MARLFNGNSGTSDYDSANAKFNEVNSNDNSIFQYTAANFAQKVDLSVAGVIMDCGECHVGGGGMEYVPNMADINARTSLRTIATSAVNGGPAIDDTQYTAFNYFIDTYDVDRDEDEGEVMYMDYTKTGTMEMDCLLCHMPGYDYAERTFTLRSGKIDATRAVGAGFAEVNPAAWPSGANTPAAQYGTHVTYDLTQFENVGGNLVLSANWMDDNLSAKPDSTNCAFCHMNKPGVDWKKRGDNWPGTITTKFYNDATDAIEEHEFVVPIDGTYEVHTSIGCMGCHERKPTALQPNANPTYRGANADNWPTQGTGMLGHDPAKGSAPFSSLYNANDYAAFKKCEDCHAGDVEDVVATPGVDNILGTADDVLVKNGEAYGAPNAAAAHAAAGLTAKIVQATNSVGGIASISHIDLMDCAACHSRKIDSQGWMNNGNPMVDATGSDAAGRMTDHENDYVIKQDMTDRNGLAWYKGKLIKSSMLNTLFWRDKNDTTLDANMDGRGGGMDALLMTQVNKVNEANNWTSITEDNHGIVDAADITERQAALAAELVTWTGDADPAAVRLSMMHVAFKDQHGVSPASMAWGAGGCTDCHSPAAEFYNGSIDTMGDGVDFTWAANQVVPFTKVNGFSQATDMHPNVKDKFGVRTIASRVTLGDVYTPLPRAATMYEGTFMGKAPYADSYEGGTINLGGVSEAGWLFMVDCISTVDGAVTSRTRGLPSGTNAGTIAELLTALGVNFTTNQPEFSIAANTAGDGLEITAKAGFQIRLKGGVDNSASFGLTNAAYVAKPWTGTDGNTYTGRADWVAYLDTLGTLPAAGQAAISAVPATATVGVPVTLVADEAINSGTSGVTYSWICDDTAYETLEGASVQKTFTKAGTWRVTLKAVDAFGDLYMDHQDVTVSPYAAATSTVSPLLPSGSATQTMTFANLPAHDELYIFWGDGTKERVYDTAASVAVDHTFKLFAKYVTGPDYFYDLTLKVYNAGAVVETMQQTIQLTNP